MKTASRTRRVPAPLFVLLGLAGLLAACSDGVPLDENPPATQARAANTPKAGPASAPLLSADGSVLASDPRLAPTDPAARTQQQHYASLEQARALESALRGGVLWVTVDCCDAAAQDLAVLTAYGMQAAQDLPDNAPVFVTGSHLSQAAPVVDRLAAAGMGRVFLVTR